MSKEEFGEIRDVPLREVWGHEAQQFTPWLAANMERLSEAIGVPMEPEGTEVAVEQFSADIVARNSANGGRVLIEPLAKLLGLAAWRSPQFSW